MMKETVEIEMFACKCAKKIVSRFKMYNLLDPRPQLGLTPTNTFFEFSNNC